MIQLEGIGKLDRERLSTVLRASKGSITVELAADALNATRADAAKMLSRWCKKGWLSRVKRGLYIPVPLESRSADVPLEDPWAIAVQLYSPCYVGGWSAAEYWDLTEQIFRTTIVITERKPRDRNPTFLGSQYKLKTIDKEKVFGLNSVWRGQVKVSVSDPTRTILDMLSDPKLGGGIRSVEDMLKNYLRSDMKDLDLLFEYARRLENGAAIKRLGFLLERNASAEKNIIEKCLSVLTKGNVKLDTSLKSDKLVTRWKIWVPESWKKGGA
jgi:predicted transcriptional regulator of viral defense system